MVDLPYANPPVHMQESQKSGVKSAEFLLINASNAPMVDARVVAFSVMDQSYVERIVPEGANPKLFA